MTLVTLIVNKFLTLLGATEVASTASSTVSLFAILAIASTVTGMMTIANRRPVLSKYKKYTDESLENASLLLGLSDLALAVLHVIIGVLTLEAVPTVIVSVAAGAVLAAFIVIDTLANKKLVKKSIA